MSKNGTISPTFAGLSRPMAVGLPPAGEGSTVNEGKRMGGYPSGRKPVSKAAIASFVLALWVALDFWSFQFSYHFLSIGSYIDRLSRARGWEWMGMIILALWFVAPLVAIELGVRGYRRCQTGEARARVWAVLGIVVATLDLSLKILFAVVMSGCS